MDDLGKYLKAERKKQKVSIDEIASHTKIPIRFIQAIEANQFNQIPNAVSAKGFIRSYARFLDLDSTTISEAFDEKLHPMTKGASSREKQDEILSYLQVKRPSRLPFPRRVILLVGGVVLLLLIFVGLLPERKSSLKKTSPPPLLENQITTGEDELAEGEVFVEEIPTIKMLPTVKKQSAPPQEEVSMQEKAESKTEEIMNVAEVSPEKKEGAVSPEKNGSFLDSSQEEHTMNLLYVEAIEPTWVQVQIDGDGIREALLQANDSIRWKAKEKFLLKVGNAGGVKVHLNGKELSPLGPSGEVVEKEIIGITAKAE